MRIRSFSVILILSFSILFLLCAQGEINRIDPAMAWMEEVAAPSIADKQYAKNEDIGETLYAHEENNKAYIVSKGFFGYHLDEKPSVTMGVVVENSGKIAEIKLLNQDGQTPSFFEMISQSYLDSAYIGKTENDVLNVDVVSGATATCKAVEYAVQTSLIYAKKAFSYGSQNSDEDLELMKGFYPGVYSQVTTAYMTDAKKYGTVLFAAENDGTLILKVQSGKKVNYKRSSDTGWPAAEPDPYIMLIAIDKNSRQVVAAKVLVDGTKKTDYFVVPDEKILTYYQVKIVDETVFDDYKEGLVLSLTKDVEYSTDSFGYKVITGTSIVYTGASVDGTFSSQLIRNCFKTAARFFCNYKSQ